MSTMIFDIVKKDGSPGRSFKPWVNSGIREPLKRKVMIVPLVKGCTLDLWLESINTGPGEKYTAIPIIHELYVSFCHGKEAPAYEYRPFLEKLKEFEKFVEFFNSSGPHREFLVLHRSNMGVRRSPPVLSYAVPFGSEGARCSHQQIHRLYKTP